MKFISVVLALCLGMFCSLAKSADDPAGEPRTLAARDAKTAYDLSVSKAREEFDAKTKAARGELETKVKAARADYLKKLKEALSAAMTRKDLAEANRIDAQIKALASATDIDAAQQVTYLSDLEESEVDGHAYGKKGWGLGEKVIAGGVYSPNGILLHPGQNRFGHVKFPLPGAFKTFKAKVGLNGVVKQSVSAVTFRVVGDGKVLWQSEPTNKGNEYQAVSVPIGGVKVLELQVECAGDYTGAHCAWIEPAVSR